MDQSIITSYNEAKNYTQPMGLMWRKCWSGSRKLRFPSIAGRAMMYKGFFLKIKN